MGREQELMKKQDLTMEETFEALDNIVRQLESGDSSLEDAFVMYQKGMELLKECSKKIDTVEKKMLILNENGDLCEF